MVDYSAKDVKTINEKVNELLIKCDNRSKNPTIDPSVDIIQIAKEYGVKDVQYVSPCLLDGKHAIYKNGVVMIDETDSSGQREFDLAHEVGHIVFNYITTKAARQGESRKSKLSPREQKIELFLDRFAANLLVPIHRFQLWEDKTDKEIAKVFNVEEKCIKKRREEIKHELSILTAKMKPCSIEDIVDPDVKLDIDALLEESTVINANR